MKFNELKERFIEEWKEGSFYDSSRITYRRKIEVFYEYLIVKCGVNNVNYMDILRGINEDRIIESVRYYIKEYDIKFKVTVDNYITVIKAFFNYIEANYNITNKMFDSSIKYSTLIKLINDNIRSFKLNLSKQKPPITEEALRNIISFCEVSIEKVNESIISKGNEYNNELRTFISSIITKIVILTGVKNYNISEIKYLDYNKQLNLININGFNIHLPDRLGCQMEKYIKIRGLILDYNGIDSQQYLFINSKGMKIGKDYSYMFEAVSKVISNRSAESISKNIIMKHIEIGTNLNCIKELTGFSLDTIMHCQELLNDKNGKEDNKSKNRHLDSQIRALEIFDIL